MKQIQILSLVLLLGFMATTACTNDTVNPTQTDLPNDAAWKVTLYWDQDKDETSDFAAYLFYFRDTGMLEAVSGNTSTTGTWKITNDDGMERLMISGFATKPLSNLSDDWVIVNFNTDQIDLRDDNSSHLEDLRFELVP